jgi:hypothetical protein
MQISNHTGTLASLTRMFYLSLLDRNDGKIEQEKKTLKIVPTWCFQCDCKALIQIWIRIEINTDPDLYRDQCGSEALAFCPFDLGTLWDVLCLGIHVYP